MNIYRIIEDGIHGYIQAETMSQAVQIVVRIYLQECEADDPEYDGETRASAIEFYHESILQSCEFLGVLKNPSLGNKNE